MAALPFAGSTPLILLALTLTAHAAVSPAPTQEVAPQVNGLARQIEKQLAALRGTTSNTAAAAPSATPQSGSDLEVLYRARKFKPVWLTGPQPSARASSLRTVLESAGEEGLPPARYRTDELARLWNKTDAVSRARLELLLTDALVKYLGDITQGRSDLRALEQTATQTNESESRSLKALVQKALEAPELAQMLRLLPPQDAEYQQLKHGLRQLRALALNGGWTSVAAGPMLKPGMSDTRIPAIRKRLALSGDYSGASAASTAYDAELAKAVRRFQTRHALPHEGIIGAATLNAMNVPIEERTRQVIINLERRRWSPLRSNGRQIVVNIPGFELVALRDAQPELEMPVVVGKAYQQTPVFDEKMEYLEFNPDWLVPPALAAGEYLPELQHDPASLTRKHIRIFKGLAKDAPEVDPRSVDWSTITPATMIRYAFRQEPGPWNALGQLKFMFPNPYNVYLHDTSEPQFFAQRQRTYSHGCIRVSRPHELAAWVLEGVEPPWDLARIRAAVAGGQPAKVPLPKPIPIRITYRTVLVKDDALLHFLPDVYGRDAALSLALNSAPLMPDTTGKGSGTRAQPATTEPVPTTGRPAADAAVRLPQRSAALGPIISSRSGAPDTH